MGKRGAEVALAVAVDGVADTKGWGRGQGGGVVVVVGGWATHHPFVVAKLVPELLVGEVVRDVGKIAVMNLVRGGSGGGSRGFRGGVQRGSGGDGAFE